MTVLKRPIGFRPEKISNMINEMIVIEHAGEASFLWIKRDYAARSPSYSLEELGELDERVEANLDGVRLGREFGWQVCKEALSAGEAGEVFTAAVLVFKDGDTSRMRQVLEVGLSAPELEQALIAALGWLSFQTVEPLLGRFIADRNASLCRLGIAASSFHRRDPGSALNDVIVSKDDNLRSTALKAVGDLGRIDLLHPLLRTAHDPDDPCRFQAAWSAARLGDRDYKTLGVLCREAEAGEPQSDQALEMALRCLPLAEARTWSLKLQAEPQWGRPAARAAGVIGDPSDVPFLIELMKGDEFARIAGESFCNIVGIDLDYEDLDRDAPEDLDDADEEDSDESEDEEEIDEIVLEPVMDQDDWMEDLDEDLEWPDADLVARWWQEHSVEFSPGKRYIRGKEMSHEVWQETLIKGNQRQRASAALVLGLEVTDEPIFEVTENAKHQFERLRS